MIKLNKVDRNTFVTIKTDDNDSDLKWATAENGKHFQYDPETNEIVKGGAGFAHMNNAKSAIENKNTRKLSEILDVSGRLSTITVVDKTGDFTGVVGKKLKLVADKDGLWHVGNENGKKRYASYHIAAMLIKDKNAKIDIYNFQEEMPKHLSKGIKETEKEEKERIVNESKPVKETLPRMEKKMSYSDYIYTDDVKNFIRGIETASAQDVSLYDGNHNHTVSPSEFVGKAFPNTNEIAKALSKQMNIDESKSLEYTEALEDYTSSGYGDVRQYGIGKENKHGEKLSKSINEFIDLELKQQGNANGVFYRGGGITIDNLLKLKKGYEIPNGGINSWSSNGRKAIDFTKSIVGVKSIPCLFKTNKGSQKLVDISRLSRSNSEEEAEFLSGSDAKIIVTDMKVVDFGFHGAQVVIICDVK